MITVLVLCSRFCFVSSATECREFRESCMAKLSRKVLASPGLSVQRTRARGAERERIPSINSINSINSARRIAFLFPAPSSDAREMRDEQFVGMSLAHVSNPLKKEKNCLCGNNAEKTKDYASSPNRTTGDAPPRTSSSRSYVVAKRAGIPTFGGGLTEYS